MKNSLLSGLILLASLIVSASYAQDVSINTVSIPPSLAVGQSGVIQVKLCNEDTSPIAAPVNKLMPQTSVPASVSITGISNEDGSPVSNFMIRDQTATTVRLLYTAELANANCVTFNINIVGVSVGASNTVTSTLGFEGPQTVGNLTANDNSTTQVEVTQAPMPVSLISFQGQWLQNQANQLSWTTAWEHDNDHFEIQTGASPQSLETIARVLAKGSGSAQQTYEYIDAAPLAELSYYRLKQVDTDGRSSYSKIIAIQRGETIGRLVVYPNPTAQELRLQLSASQRAEEVSIYSSGGERVVHQGGLDSSLQLAGLSAGVYVVEVRTHQGQVLRQRFIKL